MSYNYLFEIAAICILSLVFYDYRSKMRVHRIQGILFQGVLLSSLFTSIVDVISCLMIEQAKVIPISLNVFVAVCYFVLQATMIYALASFSFLYMNKDFGIHSWGFRAISLLYGINLFFSLASAWTGWYFYFDDSLRYIQGPFSDWGYYFYYINVLACLLYAIYNRHHILEKDLKVAGIVAMVVCLGVIFQHSMREILIIGFAMTLTVLYVYMTLENPNDYQDKLTLCTNNYGFKILIDSKCASSRPFTVVFLDIKKFRYVNAIYGIENGNHLLQQTVLYLEKIFPHNIVFRINDDVFALHFYDVQEKNIGEVNKIRERFAQEWELPDGRKVSLEVAMAVCEYPKYFKDHTELIELRNYTMKMIKGTHEGDVLYANSEIAEKYRRREAVERALRKALNIGTLEVVYQAIFDSNSQTITAAEALSRLNDKELGFIPPDEFISVAEKTGLIISLGFYVLEKVCTFIESKLLPDSNNTITCIHVNMSMLQCAYPKSNAIYLEIIGRHHIPPEMIHFELTESSMVTSPDLVRETMEALIEAGIHFSLDDYGTGFSNISYLLQFPFDKVKFDKNMVWSYFDNPAAQTIMKNEFRVFQTIKKDIILEGIETRQQYEALKENGIHLFQGYFFSRPVSEEKCVCIVHQWSVDIER